MRTWLRLGVASAGMGAALLGFSLVGPGPGAASADTGADSSASSDSSDSSHSGKSGTAAPSASSNDDTDADDADGAADDAESDDEDADEVDEEDADDDTDDADADADGADVAEPEDADDAATSDETTEDEAPLVDEPRGDDSIETVDLVDEPTTNETTTATADVDAEDEDEEEPERPWDEVVQQFLDDWTERTVAWIDTLNVSDQRKLRMEESFYDMRRAFFNQAPTVDPIQITGVISGSITGAINAKDEDEDRIIYRIVQGPKTGSLRLHADGTYTYTPNEDFNGVDTFTVMAIDAGLHINILNLLRPRGTEAESLINQGAITFDFDFKKDPEGEIWTPNRRAALQLAADELTWYFRVTKPVTLSYDVEGYEDWSATTLMSARGDLIVGEEPGFARTILQHEIITGKDLNGEAADGHIWVNFGNKWALTDVVGKDEYDFVGTAIHEMMHSLGWSALSDDTETARALYASFVVTKDGDKVYNADGTWNSDYDDYRVGKYGGLYFGGANAEKEYGGYVPLYTPADYSGGSSVAHLDDGTFSGDFQKEMNANTPPGVKIWKLSSIELAILKDLGYTVAPLPVADKDEESTDPIDVWTEDTIALIDGLQISDKSKLALEQSFFAMRRALFNRAPKLDPVQITGLVDGPISGKFNADDPDLDDVVFRLVNGPKTGSVKLHADGTYTYTPNEDFNGVDTFTVVAIDEGLHLNLANLFRPLGTHATPLINQGAITFDFKFKDPSGLWTDKRVKALEDAANELLWLFRVTKPVTLTYEVTGVDVPESPVLAVGASALTNTTPGFHQTLVQHEILTGDDTNGQEVDGTLLVNFGHLWATYDITTKQHDFTAAVMRELLHSFGFGVVASSANSWNQFASLVTTKEGASVWNSDYTINTQYGLNFIGQNGGLYFGGENAVDEYGGPIKLYTPDPIDAVLSYRHLDPTTFSGDNAQLMTPATGTGPRLRVLSALERAILKDLGFTVVALPEEE